MGSGVVKGIRAKASIITELRSIPSRDPKKNRLPIFFAPRMKRGRLISTERVPTLPTPVSSTMTMARPEMPPELISLDWRNREKPRENRALPIIVAGIHIHSFHFFSMFFLLLFNCRSCQKARVYTSKRSCFCRESSSFSTAPAAGIVLQR